VGSSALSKETGKKEAPGATAQGMSEEDALSGRALHNSVDTV
jgi:hypothetical protein